MRRRINLNFSGFWPSFNRTDNYFYNILKTKYDLNICDNPDFLIYTTPLFMPPIPFIPRKYFLKKEFKKYNCIRIFYTGENFRPDFSECDYAFSFDFMDNPNNYRLPHYALYADPQQLIKKDLDVERVLREKTKFCNFVYSNWRARKRYKFFLKLSKYKRVDSGGRFKNNIGGPVQDKLTFIKDYKFTIAFENVSYSGYTTEKLMQPMLVHSLAIYWGNELVHKDFNPKSFINANDFADEDELLERIIEIDRNDDLYLEYLRQPYFHNNTVNEYVNPENVLKQFDYIFNNPKEPVAVKKKKKFLFLIV
jgi:hypothetical protein